jgi:hypothetical protein
MSAMCQKLKVGTSGLLLKKVERVRSR